MSADPAMTAALAEADDDVLLARYVAGDVLAFETLYDRYEAPIFGFCLRLLADRDGAEDVFQETMTAVIERAGVYKERGRFRSWIFSIARNACLDRVRRGTRRRELLATARNERGGAPPDPERSLALRDEVARVLSRLPADQREILVLHRYEGFSYGEIARLTGSTEAAVKQKAYRALCLLRGKRQEST